jgi:hypothetical protein
VESGRSRFARPIISKLSKRTSHRCGADSSEACRSHPSGTPALRHPSTRRNAISPDHGMFSCSQAIEKSGFSLSRAVRASVAAAVSAITPNAAINT